MKQKRVTLFAGHYGSGKTNIAVNYAVSLRRQGLSVAVCDLDIVNPYFRTKDSREMLDREGIELIASDFANSNSDMPSLPSQTYSVVQRHDKYAVMDVGGDDRGALALGRYRPFLEEENDFEMLFVVNFFRPLTKLPEQAFEVMQEIEAACKMPFSGIVNNSNVGRDTTAADVLWSRAYASELGRLCGLPVRMTSAARRLAGELSGKVNAFFPLDLQEHFFD